jgi:single-stranded-DNA-specific exonuclease
MTGYDTRMTLRIARRNGAHQSFAGELHPVLRRIYGARGVRSPLELDLSLARLLPVSTLTGVDAAVELFLAHRAAGRVLIVGDFDADGATSTALMVRALRAWGFAHVDFLVPNRFAFGYGLSPEIVALAAERAPTLLVTVDNGMSSLAGVAAARARGIEVLITDHHLPASQLPDANVIVNPNAAPGTPSARSLAGVGVAFYVLAALKRHLDASGLSPPGAVGPAEFLDLVALGTVADLVPLDANNRVLIAQGLRRIRAGRCAPGIRCLLEMAGRNREETSAGDLAYAVAPRINAAGRLDDMTIGIQCLLADDIREATPLAARLDQLNDERRVIEARMQAEALAAVRRLRDPLDGLARHGVCLFDAGWHQGVIGLVAGRVKERIRRPVIAFAAADDGSLRGSARSIAGVHIRDVLDAIAARDPGLIVRFGGHAMAAGLTLERAHLDRFARSFDAEVGRWMGAARNVDSIETDGELALDEICLDTANALRAAGPWGQSFPEPCFDGLFTLRAPRLVGDRHVKMWVDVPGTGRAFDAIAFNHAEHPDVPLPQPGDARLVYRLDVNAYQGERRLQLLVDHVLPASVTVS